jgi:hypothetical protein
MKVIDKTPFQDESGNIGVVGRVQGALKYGPNWYPEVGAQRAVIDQLERLLDKGFVLIRNLTLPDSDIVIPMILLGPGSVSVMLASPVKGQFEARGPEWNQVINTISVPAKRNLIDLTMRLTQAFSKYIERNKIALPVQPESVLITTNPGATVESVRPALRVVRSDAVKQLANTLNQSNAVLRAEQVSFLAEQIVDLNLIASRAQNNPEAQGERPLSRAQAIFKAGEESAPGVQPKPQAPKPGQKKRGGITGRQMLLLGSLGLFECCILAAAAFILFFPK